MKKISKVASFQIPEKDAELPPSSPPSESKLRFVLSNFTHDSRFIYQPPNSANFVNPRKRLLNLSQPIGPENDGSEPNFGSAPIPNLKIEKSPKNAPSYNGPSLSRDSSLLMNEGKEVAQTYKPKEMASTISTALPILSTKNTQPLRMKDLVRRKSCHCSDCGGLSKFEKKTLDIMPELKKKKKKSDDELSDINKAIPSPNLNPKSPTKNKKGGDARSKGITLASLLMKRRDSYQSPQQSPAAEVSARNRSKTSSLGPNFYEFNKAEGTEKPLEQIVEPSTEKSAKIIQENQKKADTVKKALEEFENAQKAINFKSSQFKATKVQMKKIELRKLTPTKAAKGAWTSRIEYNANNSNITGKGSIADFEAVTERKQENSTRQSPVEQAKIFAVKKLLDKKQLEHKPVDISSLDKVPESAALEFCLKKVERKSNKSIEGQRSSSVSKLSDASSFVQRGVNNATKCYTGAAKRSGRNEERLSIMSTSSWVGKIKADHLFQREAELAEKEALSLRSRRSQFNMMKEDMTCEKILRSVRDSLERERDVGRNDNEGKENGQAGDRINKLEIFMPMLLMNNRIRISKSKEMR